MSESFDRVKLTRLKYLQLQTNTLVPEVFLDFSLLEMTAAKRRTRVVSHVYRFAALSSISHLNAEKNQGKPLGPG